MNARFRLRRTRKADRQQDAADQKNAFHNREFQNATEQDDLPS
jgi:hypothetical protein